MQSNPTPLISRRIYNVWFIINISPTIVDNTLHYKYNNNLINFFVN